MCGSDLGQFGSADDGVVLLKESSSGALVVVAAGVGLCVAVRGTEVVATPAVIAGGQASLLPTEKAVLEALLLTAASRLHWR